MNHTPCPNCGWVHPNVVQVAATKRQRLALVMQHVAIAFDVTIEELRGPRRGQRIAEARQLVMAVGRFETKLSLEEIGFTLKRDHTTVTHGIQATAHRYQNDHQFAAMVRVNFPDYAKSLDAKAGAA